MEDTLPDAKRLVGHAKTNSNGNISSILSLSDGNWQPQTGGNPVNCGNRSVSKTGESKKAVSQNLGGKNPGICSWEALF